MAFKMQIRLFRCLSEGVGCRQYVLNFKLFWIWSEGGGQTFYVKDVGGDDDVDVEEEEEEDVRKANILVSEASKLSAGARIFKGP